jgi:hypothetical protein
LNTTVCIKASRAIESIRGFVTPSFQFSRELAINAGSFLAVSIGETIATFAA